MLNYVAGSDKGGVRRGDLFNGVYAMGRMTEDRMNYTGERVVEILPAGQQAMALAWTPVVGSIKVMAMDGSEVDFRVVDAADLKYFFDKRLNPNHYDEEGKYQGALAVVDGKEGFDREIELGEYKDPAEDAFGWRGGYGTMAKNADNPEAKKAVILSEISDLPCKVAYVYDNVVIPQDDLPILSAHLESIHLQARARRIAIYFSQISAFQAQAEYGLNLGDQLAEQAVGELAYKFFVA